MARPATVLVDKTLLLHPPDRERLDLMIELAFTLARERGSAVAVEMGEAGRLRLGEPGARGGHHPYVCLFQPGNARPAGESLSA